MLIAISEPAILKAQKPADKELKVPKAEKRSTAPAAPVQPLAAVAAPKLEEPTAMEVDSQPLQGWYLLHISHILPFTRVTPPICTGAIEKRKTHNFGAFSFSAKWHVNYFFE